MGKPSIFSKDYEKRMKKRRKRLIGSSIAIIIVVCIALLSFKVLPVEIINNVKHIVFGNKQNEKVKDEENNKKETEQNKKVEENIKKETPKNEGKEEKEEKGVDLTLKDGRKIKCVFEEINGKKVFKYISPVQVIIPYSISPSGKNMVIFEEKIQKITLVDTNGEVKDITQNIYKASGTNDIYNKEEILKSNAAYIWHSTPAFVDDKTIAYYSNLPWFGRKEKYIWLIDITNMKHRCLYRLKGDNIKIGKLEDSGLNINIDDNVFYLKGDGNIVK